MDNTIKIYDEDGSSKIYEILFTYEDEGDHKSYVFYYDPADEETVFVSKYDEQGHLFPLEDGDEWERADEILSSYRGSGEGEKEVCEGEGCE